MRPSKRYGVNKKRGARKFRKSVGRTQRRNLQPGGMRGGNRL